MPYQCSGLELPAAAQDNRNAMAKGYWVTWYRAVFDSDAHARYALLAGPILEAYGGKFLVRGMSSISPEGAANERAVVIEFESVDQALAAYNSVEYQAILGQLIGLVDRDVRIFEALSSPVR